MPLRGVTKRLYCRFLASCEDSVNIEVKQTDKYCFFAIFKPSKFDAELLDMLKISLHKLPIVGEMIFSQIIVMRTKEQIKWITPSFKNTK